MTDNKDTNKKITEWVSRRYYESKEKKGLSDEDRERDTKNHVGMVIAPIEEANEKGEISLEEADRQRLHQGIKILNEMINDKELEIDNLKILGRSTKPLEEQIKEYKKQIVEWEQKIQKLDASSSSSHD